MIEGSRDVNVSMNRNDLSFLFAEKLWMNCSFEKVDSRREWVENKFQEFRSSPRDQNNRRRD